MIGILLLLIFILRIRIFVDLIRKLIKNLSSLGLTLCDMIFCSLRELLLLVGTRVDHASVRVVVAEIVHALGVS